MRISFCVLLTALYLSCVLALNGIYIVLPGDTLTSIAEKLDVPLLGLEQVNEQIQDFDLIFAGEVIQVPEGLQGHLSCGDAFYLPTQYTCYDSFLCPILDGVPTLKCGEDCYLPSQYSCDTSITKIIQISLTLTTTSSAPISLSRTISSSPSLSPSQFTSTFEEIVIGGTTYDIGNQTSTITTGKTTVYLAPEGIIIGTDTISWPVSNTNAIAFSTDGIQFTVNLPSVTVGIFTGTTSSRLTTSAPSVTAVVIDGAIYTLGTNTYTFIQDGSTLILGTSGIILNSKTFSFPPTQTGPFVFSTDGLTLTETVVPLIATTLFTETITASDGSSTIEVTLQATTLPEFANITSNLIITTTESGTSATIIVGPGGLVWGCTNCNTLSGFPSISYPAGPPFIPSTNPFPSSQFTLPLLITTVVTTSGPNGVFVTMETGTSNSVGVIVPVSILNSGNAAISANALATGIRDVAAAVSSFSASPKNSQVASSASAVVKSANDNSNSFGRDLGIALAGLCFIFCKTVSAAATTLGSLETAVDGIIGGALGVAALTGLLGSLAGLADELEEEAKEESSLTTSSSTSSSSSSSSVSYFTVTAVADLIPSDDAALLASAQFILGLSLLASTTSTVSTFSTSTIKRSYTPSSTSSVFTCGQPASCEMSGCDGTYSDGSATCQGNFQGCTCIPSSSTPGFCGQEESCERNGCDGIYSSSDGFATCQGAFQGCRCLPSSSTPSFCGTPQPCGNGGCAGKVIGGNAICQGNFAGCQCIPSASTPGFCTNLVSCQFGGCDGKVVTPGSNLGICQGGREPGCACEPDASTPGFCRTVQSCSANGCQGTQVGAGSAFGTCQAGSQIGCECLFQSATTTASSSGPTDNCEEDCLAMLTGKINGLSDPICTDDSNNNWIDSGSSPAGFTDWWRLDSSNNCFLILAKQSGSGSFPDGYCFKKSFVQDWVTNNALGCESGDAFFRPSQPLPNESEFTGEGMVCLSNFQNYQLCGSSTLNGGTDFGAGGGIKPPR